MKQVILITGAGSGIGRAVTEALALDGHKVYAAMRDIDSTNSARRDALIAFAKQNHVAIEVVELNALSEPSCRVAVDYGRLDVVVKRWDTDEWSR
jgi:NAD(P)-dependent dehydrogenase (short-subunit alcohol dehydrogenase family)